LLITNSRSELDTLYEFNGNIVSHIATYLKDKQDATVTTKDPNPSPMQQSSSAGSLPLSPSSSVFDLTRELPGNFTKLSPEEFLRIIRRGLEWTTCPRTPSRGNSNLDIRSPEKEVRAVAV